MAASTELGKAYVQIIPSAQGISGKIAEAIGGEADKAGEDAGNGFSGKLISAAKSAIAAAGIGKALSASIAEGAALEQSIGGVETLYGDAAETIKSYAKDAFRTAGLSANQYMEQSTSFAAALVSSLSGDTASAAEAANTAIVDMADNSNKMGTSMQDIQNAYQGFAKQNYTMLDNLKLGYGGTKTEMERLLADAQKLTGVKYDINNLSDVYSAIHVIQTDLGITGTTSQEAATTLTGSFAAVKAAALDAIGAMTTGDRDMLQNSLNGLAETIVTFLTGNLLPALWNILYGLPGALATFVQSLSQQLIGAFSQNFSGGLPQILEQGVQLVASLDSGISSSIGQLSGAAVQALGAFLSQIIADLPQVIQAGGQMLQSLAEGQLNSKGELITSAAELIATLLGAIVTHLPEIISAGFDLILNLIQGIGNAAPNIIRAAESACKTLWDAIKSVDWVQLGKDIISGLINGIGAMAGALWDAASSVASSALDAIKDFFGIASPSRVMRDEVGRYIPAGLALGIRQNTGEVADAMDELSALSTGSVQSDLRMAISAGTPQSTNAASTVDVDLTPILAVLNSILYELRHRGGDIVIGDDVIGRAAQRWQRHQEIMMGGAF